MIFLTLLLVLTRSEGVNNPHIHGKGEYFGNKGVLVYPGNNITIICSQMGISVCRLIASLVEQ